VCEDYAHGKEKGNKELV